MSTSVQVQQPGWIFNANAPAAVNGVPVAQPNFVNNAFGQFVLVTSNQQVQFVLNPYGYQADGETAAKNDETRTFWIKHYANAVLDLTVTLTKKA
jgi:hypothetical protein